MNVAVYGRLRLHSANGVDRTIEGHIGQLKKRGHHVTLISTGPPAADSVAYLDENNIGLIVAPASLWRLIKLFLKLRNRFDLVCIHSVFVWQNWLVCGLLGGAWITTPNGGYSPGQLKYKSFFRKKMALFFFEKRMLENALAVHTLSKNETSQVLAIAPRATCITAPNGCRGVMTKIVNNEKSNTRRLLFIGRISIIHKGLDRLFDALNLIGCEHPWVLDVIGPGSEADISLLRSRIKNSCVLDRINFRGPLYGEDKMKILLMSDIFVHLSRWEGMPFSVVEALAAGKPVLITRGTNMADLVSKHQAGWIAEDVSIGYALRSVITSGQAILNEYGKNALRLVETDLSWDSVGDALYSQVEQLLDKTYKR
jgi:glycosyltransferase involved in cell wall biosynthesis